MSAKQSKLLAAIERRAELLNKFRGKLQDVLVLDGEISEVENELLEAREELRKLTVARMAEVEGLRVSDTARVVVDRCGVRKPNALKVNLGLLDQGAHVSSGSLWIEGLRLGTNVCEQFCEDPSS